MTLHRVARLRALRVGHDMMTLISRIAALLLLAGCATPDPSATAPASSDLIVKDWRIIAGAKSTVRVGAAEAEVRRILGRPTQVSSDEPATIRWSFSTGGDPLSWAHVDFGNEKVTKVESGWAPHCK